jgi:glycosyltransferase involved in cell wall biosynthesis
VSPRNVLFLIRSWAFGGSHTIVLHLMQHLPKDRFNVICVPYDTFTGLDELFISQVVKRGLTLAEERIPWKSRSNWFQAREAVSDLIQEYSIDLIHTHDPHSNTMIGIGRAKWPCACVASAYGWWDGPLPLRRTVYQWIEREFALRRFERVITVSEHMKARILKGPTKVSQVRVIHTGIDSASLLEGGDGAKFRARFGIPDTAAVLGTLSRVSVEKGHCYLLDALSDLRQAYPDAYLTICGDGPARLDLEAQCKRLGLTDRVVFTGFIDSIADALAAMDIFVQPSVEQEGFPTSLVEAQLAGLPVVASDIGGTAETLRIGETGLLTKPRDPKSLASAIGDLLSDADRRRNMGRAAQAWIQENFTLEDMIRQVSDTYDEALAAYAQR